MKKLLAFLVFITIQSLIPIKESQAIGLNQEQKKPKSDTLKNDLVLVKPLINFNEPNGGYYSEYIEVSLETIFYGAIIQNLSQVSSTEVFLEIKLLDGYYEDILETYYSDTNNFLEPLEVDTIQFNHPFLQNDGKVDLGNFKIVFTIKSNLVENDISNNTDTLSFELFNPDWVNVSRTTSPTGMLDIESYNSGDYFIGSTLKLKNQGHFLASMNVNFLEDWPYDAILIAKIYENQRLIVEKPMNTYTRNALVEFNEFFYPDSLYYFGFSVNFLVTKNYFLPIGIDTSNFHNFEHESIANIDGIWTTLNFVPAIRLVFDPEGINSQHKENQISVYPNPTQGMLSLENVLNATIELYDLSGKLLLKETSLNSNKSMDLSMFNNGNYLVKIITDDGVATKIVSILK
ncbi:MAG: T9SS type A sorting domain-containing protein [Salinivirgaceae bacterium]